MRPDERLLELLPPLRAIRAKQPPETSSALTWIILDIEEIIREIKDKRHE